MTATPPVVSEISHPLALRLSLGRRRHGAAGYVVSLLIVALCGLTSWGMKHFLNLENGFLVFLLGVAVIAVRYGTAPSVLASFASTAVLAFFFMPPIFDFRVNDVQHVFTLVVMVAIGTVIGGLTSQVLHQSNEAKRNSDRFEALYGLSRELADISGGEHLARAAARQIEGIFGCVAAVFLPDRDRGLRAIPGAPLASSFRNVDWTAARTAYETCYPTGLGTFSMAHAAATFVPLMTPAGVIGVLGAGPPTGRHQFTEEQFHMLQTLAGQLSGALERERLSQAVQSVRDEVETERMRSALLSSVSHDLRTPLAVIAGSSSSLLVDETRLDAETRRELCRTIFDNADRLARIVENLLNMTRIEAGTFRVAKQPHVLEELVGSTLRRLAEPLKGRDIDIRLPEDLPLVPLDDVLFQQVLVNLLDNVAKYVPDDTAVEIAASAEGNWLTVTVSDRGPGLPHGQEDRVFEKFFRADRAAKRGQGTGLGLTIARAIVAAHGGTMTAHNRDGGGAAFRIRIPLSNEGKAAERPVAAPQAGLAATAGEVA
jgi:two-component system, OmpR family, sensor histidine kinase KdpD